MRTSERLATAGGRGAPTRTRADRWVPWVLAAAVTGVYAVFAVLQWRLWESTSWDLGIFTQLAKAYASLETPIVPIKGEGFNLLGDHFHPLLVILGPVYALFPSGLSLLVLQAVLLGWSVQPVTSVARDLLGPGRGTALGAAYGLSWGLQGAVGAQFHEIALAVPLLAYSLAAFLRGRWWACAAWAAPLVFVKEDLGLTVAALGAVLLWRGRRGPVDGGARDPRMVAGASLVAWGLVWFWLAIWVILPALNPDGSWDYVDRFGDEDDRSLTDTLLGGLVPGQKWVTLLLLVGTAGVVGATSPLVWIWLPTLAWRFLGNVPYYWGWEWHYSAVLMPVATAALLDAVSRPGRNVTTRTGSRAAPAEWQTPSPVFAVRRPDSTWAPLAVATAVVTTLFMTPVMPLGRLAEPATWAGSGRAAAASAAVDSVERGATVETDVFLMAYLVPRAEVYWVGNPGNPPPDYVVLDAWRREDRTDAATLAEARHPGTDYELVLDRDGYQVAQRAQDAFAR